MYTYKMCVYVGGGGGGGGGGGESRRGGGHSREIGTLTRFHSMIINIFQTLAVYKWFSYFGIGQQAISIQMWR